MKLEKKYPELGSLMDGLSVSNANGVSSNNAGASGVLGAVKKIFKKWNIIKYCVSYSVAFQ